MSEEISETPQLDMTSPIALKIVTALQKKETADQAFKLGNTKDALKSYHEALMFLLGLDKNALASIGIASRPEPGESSAAGKEKEKTEIDDTIEKIYNNMSACHIKNQNWKRAVETADKALAKNPDNVKAMFRKGKALGEQGFFEKAVKVLEEAKKKDAGETTMVDQEIARLRALDDERERAHKKKLKGFLNKAEKKAAAPTASSTPASEVPSEIKSAYIEEVP